MILKLTEGNVKKAILIILVILVGLSPMGGAQDSQDLPAGYAGYGATVSSQPIAPDGTEVALDLPGSLHLRNIGGSDGSGLCVASSISHAGRWQGVEVLFDFQQWCKRFPGGSFPGKVDAQISQMCGEKKAKKPDYIQVETDNLTILELAIRTGRAVSCTMSYSPAKRYGGQRISHMVSMLHCDSKWVCFLDNNFPNTYEWCSPAEALACMKSGGRNYWAVILLNPGPPPPPKGNR